VTARDQTNVDERRVQLTVHATNEPPFVENLHNRIPTVVTLPTSNTSLRGCGLDLEGDPVTVRWTVVSQPSGAAAQLSSPTSAPCEVTNMTVVGDYVFKLKVSDPTHGTSKNHTVTVHPVNVHAPNISSAGASPSTIALPTAGTNLFATTGDDDGDVISHWWSVKSAPSGTLPSFTDQGSSDTAVSNLIQPGPYVFTLTVVDRTKHTTRDVAVTVNPEPTSTPTIGIKGDLDQDGDTDLFDILRLVDILLGRPPPPTEHETWAGDLDGDGDTDLFDVLAMVDVLLGRY